MTTPLLEVRNLAKSYASGPRWLPGRAEAKAVDGISFQIGRGETLALVGESGCGKSTTARLVTRLLEPSSGEIRFEGEDVTRAKGARLRQFRRHVQMVFQDPFASLNPRMRVADILEEPLIVHGIGDAGARARRVQTLLGLVGLSPSQAERYPHEFSGGQRQRVGIARALAVEPSLIVCDEAVSALDVSIQAQIINLLQDLQRQLGLSYLFIAHDLAVVRHMADVVAVMYKGALVEVAPVDQLFEQPAHPYTRALLTAIPRPDPHAAMRLPKAAVEVIAQSRRGGCQFQTRCPFVIPLCIEEAPALSAVGPRHSAACHRASALSPFAATPWIDDRTPGLRTRLALYEAHAARRATAQTAAGPAVPPLQPAQ